MLRIADWPAWVSFLSSFYGAAWLAALWCPLVAAVAGWGPPYPIFRQFTWWCWLLQALFYTAVHPWARSCDCGIPHLHARLERYAGVALGAVCGNVAFTFAQFCAVLLRHPTIVAEVGKQLGRPAAVQLANVGLHYCTVSALLLWTLFDIEYVRCVLRAHVHTAARRAAFCGAWTLLPLLYLASRGFDLHGVARTYGVPLDAGTGAATAASALLAAQFNLMFAVHVAESKTAGEIDRMQASR